MKISLALGGKSEPVEIDFDKTAVDWKRQNYGQFTPYGVYLKEIDRSLFVKRLTRQPLALPFLKSHLRAPCSGNLPRLYAVAEDREPVYGFRHYFFYERLEGITLNVLKGEINIRHCHEILSGVFTAMLSIIKCGYWHCDLDFRNVFVGKGSSNETVRLIDLDSLMPLSLSFKDYLSDSCRRPNVNEKYWSYVVPGFGGERLERLSGISLSQAAFIYFAVDLFFFVKYPTNHVSLKPADLNKIMSSDNDRYFPKDAKRLWRQIHNQIFTNPGEGASWRDVDRFTTMAYGFTENLSDITSGTILDGILRSAGNFLNGALGRSRP